MSIYKIKWYLPLKSYLLVMISSLFKIVHLPLVQEEKFKTFWKKYWLHTSLKILIDLQILLIVNLWTASFGKKYNKKCMMTVTVNLFRVYQSETKRLLTFGMNVLKIYIPLGKLRNNSCHGYVKSVKKTMDQLKHYLHKHFNNAGLL